MVDQTCLGHLLAGCAILLPGYDGKVTSDRPQAGEDLETGPGECECDLKMNNGYI